MTCDARRLLLHSGAGALVFALAACSSVSSAGPAVARVAIPAAARTVTLSLIYGPHADGRKPPPPVAVTSPAKVREVAALVADQPPASPGPTSCPVGDGAALDLVFRADPGGPALATAVVSLSDCETTDLTVGARDRGLGGIGSARTLAARVVTVAGTAWKLPPMDWPLPG